MATAGILMLCLPSSRIRYAGAPLLLVAFVVAVNAPRPDVLVDAEGGVVAVRGADGRLTILDAGKSRITAEGWLAADADGRKARDDLAAGFRCDRFGCIARLQDGTVIAVARTHGALAEDCREAALIVTQLEVPAACAAARVDLRMLATTGAIALRRVDGRWVAEPARSPRADRPWYGRRTPPDASALNALERREPAVRARSEPPDDRSDEEPMADAPDDADAAEE
jgi:competence protein ComEC